MKTVAERWHHYIEEGIDQAGNRIAAAYDSWRYLAPVFDRIRNSLPVGARILDLGCGAGFQAVLLTSWGYDVTAADNDPKVVEIAHTTSIEFGQKFTVLEADATNLPDALGPFDLVFTLGLIEHFDRDVAVDMLRQQARVASRVVSVIPTRHMHHAAPQTDERLYRTRALASLVREAGMTVEDAYAFGDVPTRTTKWAKRLLPPAAWSRIQLVTGYAMNLCVVGESP